VVKVLRRGGKKLKNRWSPTPDPSLQPAVESLAAESPTIKGIVDAHHGSSAPDLDFQSGSIPDDSIDGHSIGGIARSKFDITRSPSDPSKVKTSKYTGTDITVDKSMAHSDEELKKTLVEEINHAGDAMKHPKRSAQEEISDKNKVPHAQRPMEKRVAKANAQVAKERRKHQKKSGGAVTPISPIDP
jgi:hypothetical protein